MTARDYEHKRFRSPGTKEASSRDPPRVVTPLGPAGEDFAPPRKIQVDEGEENTLPVTKQVSNQMEKTDDPAFIHKPTNNGVISTQSPLRPSESLRYSLSKGKEAFDDTQREASNSESKSRQEKRRSSRRKYDPNSYKIFLLLLQPESKIFELIQLIYLPNDTTVGNIIGMIPENATEEALGKQEYIGLCRPKTEEEIVNKELLASETSSGVETAGITLGEILVAIPTGYSGADVAALSKQILSNPKIVKLLKRADPLAPKKRRSSKRRSHRSSRSRSISSRENVDVLEKHDEAEEIKQEESEEMMKKAMEHAAAEAAAANAEVPGGNDFVPSIQRNDSLASDRSMESSLQDSVDESYSSWSKSFDASFSVQSSICSGISRRQVRRRVRQARRMRILKRAAIVGFCVMVAFYMLDPSGYSAESHFASTTETPMGVTGLLQVMFLLIVLFKMERLIRATTEGYADEPRCPFLKASNAAMQQLKGKYAKRLQKSGGNKNGNDDDSISRRLQSFSLKAATFQELNNDNASL